MQSRDPISQEIKVTIFQIFQFYLLAKNILSFAFSLTQEIISFFFFFKAAVTSLKAKSFNKLEGSSRICYFD